MRFTLTQASRLLLGASLVVSVGCSSSETTDGTCSADTDCPSGFFCEASMCRCRTDDVCGDGNQCNAFGACQSAPQCSGNQDCDTGEICSAGSERGGECISASSCEFNIHCPLGEFCDPQLRQCSPGCRTAGDCPLGEVCDAGTCLRSQEQGECVRCPALAGVSDPDYCDFGDRCDAA
ncbi:MAG: hypothetical protein AAFQ82_24910, partial [Myxococcota bacterium]